MNPNDVFHVSFILSNLKYNTKSKIAEIQNPSKQPLCYNQCTLWQSLLNPVNTLVTTNVGSQFNFGQSSKAGDRRSAVQINRTLIPTGIFTITE